MSASSTLHLQIERSLERRFPSALTPARGPYTRLRLRGFRRWILCSMEACQSTRSANSPDLDLLAAPASRFPFLAQKTQNEHVVAWVDANNALDPESAAADGVVLSRLLWVRCRDAGVSKGKPWSRLDQALKATDLLLHVSGFGAIILDIGNTAPEHASRIPLATWFRFPQGAQRSRTSLVVLGKMPYAQSSAAVVLECVPRDQPIAVRSSFDAICANAKQIKLTIERVSGGPGYSLAVTQSWIFKNPGSPTHI